MLAWVRQMRRLCKPDSVHWVDGLVEEYDRLCAQMVECGTFTPLNPEKRPNSVIAGTATERSPNVTPPSTTLSTSNAISRQLNLTACYAPRR